MHQVHRSIRGRGRASMSRRPPQCTSELCVLILLVLGIIFQAQAKSSNRSRTPAPPALIVFGDSVVDPGNNNAIVTMAKCNHPPYGKDFVGHQATGRFSNGKIPSDMIASKLGIKQYVPAYLGTKLSTEDLLTGVSFASGGCGYDPLTSELVQAISMSDQLKLFKEYKNKLKEIAGETKTNSIISRSMYMVITGTDDLANTYFTTPFRRAEYDLPSYIKFVVESASSFLQELYHLGARKIIVAGISPIGCLPSQRTLAGGIERECVTLYNQAAVVYNSELSKEVQRLNDTLAGSRTVFVDMYTSLLDMIQNPNNYGFTEIARGCCGTGIFEVTLTCNRFTAPACEDVSKHIFWDTYHPTERAYEILIRKLMKQYKSFLN
ncbi:GDSL esterase/lipase [Canna indica]|uniref:GDSL esterase/lipase n=1 Tax=Canna indica TaxID=4628 RepID=A0AAQ3KI59_9LILI|nr:GDSL esterase/lipase [Canna indica]